MTYDNSILQVASMMELAARTAPKARGEDFVEILVLGRDKLEELARGMEKFGLERGRKNFDRDAQNVRNSSAVVLIGLKDATTTGLNCGACGFSTCKQMESSKPIDEDFKGPICSYRLLDLGIALGSAVKTAQILNVDNRIMYRIGVVARWLKIVKWDYLMGIPLSATGKNIYFDRRA